MFDMVKAADKNAGYRLVIHFNSETGLYTVTGYTVHMTPDNRTTFDKDGAALHFVSMEFVMKYIMEIK